MRRALGALTRGLAAIVGVLLLVYGALSAASWLLSVAALHVLPGELLGLAVPGDPGYGVSLVSVGLLLCYASVRGISDYRGLSALFVGSVLLVGLALLQSMATASPVLDHAITGRRWTWPL